VRLPDAREDGCKAQAASNAARKVVGVFKALGVTGGVLDMVLVCATVGGETTKNRDASAGTKAHLRRSEFESRNKESLRSKK
jgi:hypothetical protein